MRFLHVKFIADFRTMLMACSGRQFGLCRRFTYRTIILPTLLPHSCALLTWLSPVGFRHILLPLLLAQVITVFLDCNRFPPQWQIAKPSQTFETIEDNTSRQATQYCQDPPLSRQVW